ncbi:putative amiloride-sensitive sodium channel subunit alpha [Sesbania bispinosa]|nr:putative amiloride-sensitive sodium channel subunit alpha [Sesbania bispinosa]
MPIARHHHLAGEQSTVLSHVGAPLRAPSLPRTRLSHDLYGHTSRGGVSLQAVAAFVAPPLPASFCCGPPFAAATPPPWAEAAAAAPCRPSRP